jgi:phosphonate transport system substrate-binding protein
MHASLRMLAGATLVTATLCAPATKAQEVKEINFGIISTETSTNLKTVWQPFLDAMAKGTGLKVNGFYATDYAGVIEAQRFGKVQVAWYGNKSAMEAVDRAGGEVFAQSVDAGGSPGYWSHLLVHVDSPHEKLEDVLKCDKTLDFGNGDPNSTSGFLVPNTYVFAARNIDPKDCFKTVRSASHEANAMAVANKQVHVATGNNENLRRLETTAPEARKRIRVIWTSPLIPSDPLVWRKDLDRETKTRIYTFVLSYGRLGSPEEVQAARKVLAGLQWAPFRPSSDAQLFPIRQLELNKELLKVRADAKMTDADKQSRLAQLQKELDRIAALAGKVPSM